MHGQLPPEQQRVSAIFIAELVAKSCFLRFSRLGGVTKGVRKRVNSRRLHPGPQQRRSDRVVSRLVQRSGQLFTDNVGVLVGQGYCDPRNLGLCVRVLATFDPGNWFFPCKTPAVPPRRDSLFHARVSPPPRNAFLQFACRARTVARPLGHSRIPSTYVLQSRYQESLAALDLRHQHRAQRRLQTTA